MQMRVAFAYSRRCGGIHFEEVEATVQTLFPLASLSYHAYEGVALNPEEKAWLVRDLWRYPIYDFVQSRAFNLADNILDAFLFMFIMQRACEIQLKAQATGKPLIPIHSAILDAFCRSSHRQAVAVSMAGY